MLECLCTIKEKLVQVEAFGSYYLSLQSRLLLKAAVRNLTHYVTFKCHMPRGLAVNGFSALGLCTGIAVALACAFILKRFQLSGGQDEVSGGIAFNGQIYEITIIIMSAYLAYLVAEVRCALPQPISSHTLTFQEKAWQFACIQGC